MACGPILTGQRFVSDALSNIDCQAQTIGAFGFQALSDPNSVAVVALTGLMTIFVALFGLRLAMGSRMDGGDAIGAVLKVAIVLTLATSWPAWRTLGYELVINGPNEIAGAINRSSDLAEPEALSAQLQAIDDGIVTLTILGTGRSTAASARSDNIGDVTQGVAVTDSDGLGHGRVGFLVGVVGSQGLVRITGGLLLALAPLMAGFLLFTGAQGIFFGWLRALAATALAGVALATVHAVEVSMLQPWLNDVVAQREANVMTPSAPTELLAFSFVFALISLGILIFIIRIAFFSDNALAKLRTQFTVAQEKPAPRPVSAMFGNPGTPPSRAFLVAQSVSHGDERQARLVSHSRISERLGSPIPSGERLAAANGSSGSVTLIPRDPATNLERGRNRGSTSSQRRDAR